MIKLHEISLLVAILIIGGFVTQYQIAAEGGNAWYLQQVMRTVTTIDVAGNDPVIQTYYVHNVTVTSYSIVVLPAKDRIPTKLAWRFHLKTQFESPHYPGGYPVYISGNLTTLNGEPVPNRAVTMVYGYGYYKENQQKFITDANGCWNAVVYNPYWDWRCPYGFCYDPLREDPENDEFLLSREANLYASFNPPWFGVHSMYFTGDDEYRGTMWERDVGPTPLSYLSYIESSNGTVVLVDSAWILLLIISGGLLTYWTKRRNAK